MEYVNKIKEMLEKGDITFEQGKLLFEWFKDSDKHEKAVFEQIELQKHKRQKNIWGILAAWSVLLMLCLVFLMLNGNSRKLGPKTIQAIRETDFASIYIAKGDYDEAIDQFKKSVNIDPSFSLGYSMLALTNKLLYKETGKKEYLVKSNAAMDSLLSLIVKKDIQRTAGGGGLVSFVIFIVLLLSILKLTSIVIYSILIKKEERVNKAWAQIIIFYLRKIDLIPSLIEAIREYSTHEKENLKTALIAASQAKEKLKELGGIAVQNNERLEQIIGDNTTVECSLRDVYIFIERFPKIRTEKKYILIQKEFDDTEKSLYKAIERYNTRIRLYNSTLRSLPFSLISGKLGFSSKAYINFKG